MKVKNLTFFMIVAILLVVTSCNRDEIKNEPPFGNQPSSGNVDEPVKIDSTFLETTIEQAGTIDMSELSRDIDDSNAIELTTNEITTSGDYILTGEYENGIIITAPKNANIHLFLKDANINCQNGKAVSNVNKNNIVITILGNNVVENSGDDVNALHLKGSVAINGSGVLHIISHSKSAIKVSKNISIVDVTLIIDSTNHGITAESIAIKDASIQILNALKDGLHAECDYDEPDSVENCVFDTTIGYVSLVNVQFASNTLGDGIQADTFVYVNGGNYQITTTGDFVSKSVDNMTTYGLEEDDFKYIKVGNAYQRVASDYRGKSTLYALMQGCKGIKVGEIEFDVDGDGVDDTSILTNANYAIVIKNGNFIIDSTDDAIHANSGDILIQDGNYTIHTLDDGVTADNLLKILSGDINILSSYEGLEGGYVEIEGGNISITSLDDGINAASDDSSIEEHIIISGGKMIVNASGDGIDSNGCILITDGEVIIFGAISGSDSGFDSETGILVKGGTLFVTSTLGMVEMPGSNSTSFIISYASQTTITSGSSFMIADQSGNVLYAIDILKNCQVIILSIEQLELNGQYSLYINNQLVEKVTILFNITNVGVQNGPNMPGGPGGIQPR